MSKRCCVVLCCVSVNVWMACSAAIPLLLGADGNPVTMRIRRDALTERAIRKTLDEITNLEFIETPLQDVVDYLEDLHGVPIAVDARALGSIGIGTDTPITASLRGVSLRSALNIMLRGLELTYIIRDESLVVTTVEEAESYSIIEVYTVADLAPDEGSLGQLVDAVTVAWDEPKWHDGPTSAVSGFRGLMIVRGSQSQHERVRLLLTMLRNSLGVPQPPQPHPLQGWQAGSSVDLSGVRLTVEDLAYLQDQKQITSLNLSATGIGDDALEMLGRLENLERLNLSQTRVTSKSFPVLKALPKLQYLNIADIFIADEDLKALGMFTHLKELTVGNVGTGASRLTYEGVKQLGKSLPDCKINADVSRTRNTFFDGQGENTDPFGAGADPFEQRSADPFDGSNSDPFGER